MTGRLSTGRPTILGRADGEPGADRPVGGTSSEGRGSLFRALFLGVPAPLLVRLPPRVLPYLAEPGLVVLYVARLVLQGGSDVGDPRSGAAPRSRPRRR